MSAYYIGYSINDNYFFSLTISISDTKVLIDNKNGDETTLTSNRMKVLMENYLYKGRITPKVIDGKLFQIQGRKIKRFGTFYCKRVDKKSYIYYHTFKNPFLWFLKLNNLKSKSIVYPPITNITGFQLSVMSFNVCSSFTWTSNTGINSVVKIISRSNTDIVCLQEIDPSLISKIGSRIYKRFGIKYYTVPKCCILTKFKPTRIYTRTPLSPVYGIRISHDGIRLRIFNSHLTDKGFDDPDLSKEIQYPQLKIGLYDLYSFKNNPELPTILAGDHNTISHLDDSERNWKVSTRLQNDGWIDSYRSVNPDIDMNRDYSYPNCNTNKMIHINETGDQYCPSIHQGKLYRIDYIYSKNGEDTGLIPVDSVVIDKLKGRNFPSDHNVVITTFNVTQ